MYPGTVSTLSLLETKNQVETFGLQNRVHMSKVSVHNTLAMGSDTYFYDEALKSKSLLRDFPGRFECTSVE